MKQRSLVSALSMLFLFILLTLLSACGSSGGSSETSVTAGSVGTVDGAAIRVAEPSDGVVVRAGGVISYTLETTNFVLSPPFDRRNTVVRDHPHGEEVADEHHHHGTTSINTAAREGHYHIYLDGASGSDPHVTAWSQTGEYLVPADLSPGPHTLRFELRDNNHVLVGTPGSETVLFFEVQ